MRLHYLQHVPFEDPGYILEWADLNGVGVGKSLLYRNDPIPSPDDFDFLAIMGGPMNIHEEEHYPWMKAEKECIRQSIAAGKGILGICLGAQLLADALGGSVEKGTHKEIGWFDVLLAGEAARSSPVFKFFPDRFNAFHWHGDFIRLPDRASLIASSAACPVQAFECEGRAIVGLQFHIESTKEGIERLIHNCSEELIPGEFIHDPEAIRDGFDRLSAMHALMDGLLMNMSNMMR